MTGARHTGTCLTTARPEALEHRSARIEAVPGTKRPRSHDGRRLMFPAVLHGDLTPANILDGGEQRGLVAVDPAPCLGDPAFDVIDLVLWRADDRAAVNARADRLASGTGTSGRRIGEWCSAFAAMTALELAEASTSREHVAMLVALARAAT